MGVSGLNPDRRVQREGHSMVQVLRSETPEQGFGAEPLPSESPLTTLVVIVGYIMGKPIPSLQAIDGTSTSISISAAK